MGSFVNYLHYASVVAIANEVFDPTVEYTRKDIERIAKEHNIPKAIVDYSRFNRERWQDERMFTVVLVERFNIDVTETLIAPSPKKIQEFNDYVEYYHRRPVFWYNFSIDIHGNFIPYYTRSKFDITTNVVCGYRTRTIEVKRYHYKFNPNWGKQYENIDPQDAIAYQQAQADKKAANATIKAIRAKYNC